MNKEIKTNKTTTITFSQWLQQYQDELTLRGKLARYAKDLFFPNDFIGVCDYLDEKDGTDELELAFYDAWNDFEREMKR